MCGFSTAAILPARTFCNRLQIGITGGCWRKWCAWSGLPGQRSSLPGCPGFSLARTMATIRHPEFCLRKLLTWRETRQFFPHSLPLPTKINETLLEGLRPWQPKKIYYFSDAEQPFKDSGPSYTTTGISPSHNLPYWRLAMEAFSFHLTQYRNYIEGLAKNTPAEQKSEWGDPVELIFGKSLVGGSRTGDVFEGVTPGPIPFTRVTPSGEETAHALELAGPWGFYDVFRREHGLTQLAKGGDSGDCHQPRADFANSVNGAQYQYRVLRPSHLP